MWISEERKHLQLPWKPAKRGQQDWREGEGKVTVVQDRSAWKEQRVKSGFMSPL